MKHSITKSMRDIFSTEVLGFVLKVGLGSIVLVVTLLWFTWDIYAGFVAGYIRKIPFIGSWEWFQSTGGFLTALILGYTLIIVTISVITALFSEGLLIRLAAKHYPEQPVVGAPSITRSTLLTAKATALFLVLFLFTFPLIFIPIIGQVWMLWLWSVLLKEPTTYDVGALFITDRQTLKQKAKQSRLIAMIASLFNYVPLLNIFAPVYAQILFLHHTLSKN